MRVAIAKLFRQSQTDIPGGVERISIAGQVAGAVELVERLLAAPLDFTTFNVSH